MGSIYDDHERDPERLTPVALATVQGASVYVGGNDKKSIGILSRGQAITFNIFGGMEIGQGSEPTVELLQSLGGTANADQLRIIDVTSVVGWLAVEVTAGAVAPSEIIIFWNLGRNA